MIDGPADAVGVYCTGAVDVSALDTERRSKRYLTLIFNVEILRYAAKAMVGTARMSERISERVFDKCCSISNFKSV